MKYFAYILIILFFLLPVIWIYWQKKWLRLKYLQKLTCLNILRRQQSNPYPVIFSPYILKSAVKKLFYAPHPTAKVALIFLAAGRVSKAAEYFTPQNKFLGLLLKAHDNAAKVYTRTLSHKPLWLNSPYRLYLPLLAYTCFDFTNFLSFLEHLKIYRGKRKTALYNYMMARAYLYKTDMKAASKYATKALRAYKKDANLIAEADCYRLLSEIYRLSCLTDIAYLMLNSALKIYKKMHLLRYQAETLTMQGMLLLFQNKPDMAEQKYAEALKISVPETLLADIYNQQSLLYLSQNKLAMAEKKADLALDIHSKYHQKNHQALSIQLLAQSAYKQTHYRKAVALSAKAAELYYKTRNFSAQAETLFLQASALNKCHQLNQAEKILHKIITINTKKQVSFHLANVYAQLGDIRLQKNDINEAKKMWQQSLQLEISQQRNEGIAIDYANLALLEELTDNPITASHYWENALKHSQKSGNDELIELIKNKYKPLT